jgi:hypothetical protein
MVSSRSRRFCARIGLWILLVGVGLTGLCAGPFIVGLAHSDNHQNAISTTMQIGALEYHVVGADLSSSWSVMALELAGILIGAVLISFAIWRFSRSHG